MILVVVHISIVVQLVEGELMCAHKVALEEMMYALRGYTHVFRCVLV